MAHYRVIQGNHKDENQVEHTPESGPFESDLPLQTMFVNKFKKVQGDELEAHLLAKEKREKAAAKKAKAKPKEEADEEEEAAAEPEAEDAGDGVDLAEDVTKKFDLAVKNDFKVFHSSAGYEVKDGDKVLNDKRLKTAKAVQKFLKAHLGEGDDDGAAGSDE